MNPRCSPGWVFRNHAEDERPKLLADGLASTDLPGPGEPLPVGRKPPRCHCTTVCGVTRTSGLSILTRDVAKEPRPSSGWRISDERSLGMQSQQLFSQGEILEYQVLA